MTRTVLVAPDKFKGTLPAAAFCTVAASALPARLEADRVVLSDGGEGFTAALGAAGTTRHLTVTGPLGEPQEASYLLTESLPLPRFTGRATAVIESAAACGLGLVGGAERNDPVRASTTGVGELIGDAVAAGAEVVLVGCGGSATTDGGLGALRALGIDLDDLRGSPGGRLGGAELVVACDVTARFREAARRFAPQKGADEEEVEQLDNRLARLAVHLDRAAGRALSLEAGSGAAGGLSGGLALLGGELTSGFGLVAEAVGLPARVARACAVVTGEGRLDETSFDGKVVGGLLRVVRACSLPPPTLVVAGEATDAGRALAAPATVVSLSERFSPDSAHADPARLVGEVTAAWAAGVTDC